jgi:hypothetical protein
MLKFEQILDNVMQLPLEQREMLIDILLHRHVEQRREEIAQNTKEAISDFRAGRLKPQSAKSIISELRSTLNGTEEE